jgi:hypothetical protein
MIDESCIGKKVMIVGEPGYIGAVGVIRCFGWTSNGTSGPVWIVFLGADSIPFYASNLVLLEDDRSKQQRPKVIPLPLPG